MRSLKFSTLARNARRMVLPAVSKHMMSTCGANKLKNPGELRAAVSSWTQPYSPGPLTPEELVHFYDKGWVLKQNLLPNTALEQAIDSVNGLVDDIANRLYAYGKISDSCKDLGFHERLIALDDQFEHCNVLLHKNGVLPDGIAKLWSHSRLLDCASQILGQESDIVGHPVWNLRCKTPERLSKGQATVPWHQDNSYLDEECWDKLQVTAWVPLVDANVETGCMQVLSGGHLSGVTAEHTCCVGGTWYNDLSEAEMNRCFGDLETITCEVNFGSVLFLNNIIPHRSLPNLSSLIRWSLDLRWQRAGEPNGFSGIKESLLMRPAGCPEYEIRWKGWAEESRTEKQMNMIQPTTRDIAIDAAVKEGDADDDFDTTICGPWMERWEIVHHNRHTASRIVPPTQG